MGRKTLKKAVAVLLSAVSICSMSWGYAENNAVQSEKYDSTVSPRYIAISSTYTNLSKNSIGSLNCQGNTSVWRDNAGVLVELQRYDNGWSTIKSWSDYDNDYAVIDNNWFVESGYDYRVKSTHYAYDSDWGLVESVVKYSKTVSK